MCLCCVLCASLFAVECGGKMHLREGEYEKAHTDFFEVLSVNLSIVCLCLFVCPSIHLFGCLTSL